MTNDHMTTNDSVMTNDRVFSFVPVVCVSPEQPVELILQRPDGRAEHICHHHRGPTLPPVPAVAMAGTILPAHRD